MQKDLNNLVQSALVDISVTDSTAQLYELRVSILGKSGSITNLLKGLREFSGEQRANLGKVVNDAKVMLENAFDTKQTQLKLKEINQSLQAEKLDLSIERPLKQVGASHPVTLMSNRIVQFFVKLGFTVYHSPEIDTEYYNFEALNVVADHPARDMQDTFFIDDTHLLRSHTSNGQVRAMQSVKPPFSILSPGKVYRADQPDATHSPQFHQIEGLVIDKNLSMCDLKFVLENFAKHIFGQTTSIRFRPSYFPFTEPSVEVDAQCKCNDGCKVCKGTGWIEILGAGMVNKKVLENCGISSKVYTGFAFGIGVERITDIVNGIDDMRILFENDIRFLSQFVNCV
ncbi:MAG: phenylalanine--tRNA ligase subunit alpha [Clostridiales bacterium]|jgi:phenylalanyl-tRNA synthetase alpha chain|nr:phenylalanine--tRNA ligase subunit alpha [Clostridiales bacterium]